MILAKKRKNIYHNEAGELIISTMLGDALNEIEILKKLKHPNVVCLHEILNDEENDKIYLGN